MCTVRDGWVENGSVFLKAKTEDRVFQYPGVWIRDNCQCPKCFDQSSQQRMILMKDFNLDIELNKVEVQEDQVRIIEG